MRKLFTPLCLLLVCAASANAQKPISLTPLINEAELIESPSPNIVTVQMTLKEAVSDTDKQAPYEDIFWMSCTAVDGTRRIISGVVLNPNNRLLPTCSFLIGAENTKLKPDWSKFGYEAAYKVREGAGFGPEQTFKSNSPITRCTRVSEIVAELGTASRTGDREVTIPIKVNTDARLNVELRGAGGIPIATAGGAKDKADVLFEKDLSRPIVLKVLSGSLIEADTVIYELAVSQLSSQPAANIQVKGDKNFTVKSYRPFQVTGLAASAPKDDGSVDVSFATTSAGTVKVFLNGRPEPVFDKEAVGATTFTIPADKISVGANTLNLAGESSENGLKLVPPTPLTFIREAKPFLKDTPVTFSYDEANSTLKIDFTLSRPFPTRWQFKGTDGLGRNVVIKDDAKKLYEAVIDLRIKDFESAAASKLTDIPGSLLRAAPVEIEIVNQSNSKDVIASFSINFVKPKETVIAKVKEAEGHVANNKTDAAKKAIAEALGFIGSLNNEQKAIVDASIPQLKQPVDTKSKVFKVLGIAGKIAAGMFGIPLPF